ncbi:MAG: glutamyl-tRNA reductase, partial [Burkholderiales bacterium]
MSFFALGLNHTTAPLDLRGRFAFAPEQLAPTLQGFRDRIALHATQGGPEVALLSTCNRTELYVSDVTAQGEALLQPTVDWLAGVGGVGSRALLDHSYVLEDSSAARHAFRVASGLDSMVLGEPQILGQMKQAVRDAEAAGTMGSTLQQMFQRSFAV